MGSYLDADNVRHSYASYGVLDARLQWSEPRWNAYVEGNNLLDKEYRDYGNGAAGRLGGGWSRRQDLLAR